MPARPSPHKRPPLDADSLRELALAYLGRFATSRSRLAAYLRRKLRERGWGGEGEPPVEAVVERCAELGYVDDATYALGTSRALLARGYGDGRVRQRLRAAGIGETASGAARALAQAGAVEAALRFARRRRFGPFAAAPDDRAGREKALAAMLRAGHPFGLSQAILSVAPGSEVDLEDLQYRFGTET